MALHDEAKAFAKETEELQRHAADRRADFMAGLAAFKAVLLEGVEVVFIVIAVGATRGLTLYAGLGALAAFVAVIVIGLAVHKPLSRVPENTLKFVVGLMLTSFGIFWTGEGLGAQLARRRSGAARHLPCYGRGVGRHSLRCPRVAEGRRMKLLRAIVDEVLGMFIDDGALAAFSVVLIAIAAAVALLLPIPALWAGLILLVGCVVLLAWSVLRAARR